MARVQDAALRYARLPRGASRHAVLRHVVIGRGVSRHELRRRVASEQMADW